VGAALSLDDLEPSAVAAGSLREATVLVLGAGRTGQAVAEFAARHGARVTLYDSAESTGLAAANDRFADGSVRLAFGASAHLTPLLDAADLVVHSPSITLGFPTVREEVAGPLRDFAARAIGPSGDRTKHAPLLISEPEWTIRLLGTRWRVGVTGTKGKTTTSNLIAAILAADPTHPVELGGNNGVPLIGKATQLAESARVVLELSELQLPTLQSEVDVAVYTNITVDHLDRHGTVDGYRRVKRLLADRVAADGVLIVNLDDPVSAGLAGIGRVTTVGYRRERPVPGGVGLVDGWIVAAGVPRSARYGGGTAATGPGGRIAPVDEIALPGDHSISNVLAAVSAGLVAGIAPDAIRAAVASFRGIPHRLETVAVLDGIRYVNDAQATQPDAVAAAVRSFRKPLVLLAGGRSKGLDLHDLAPIVASHCSGAVLFGELGDELESLFRAAGLTEIDRAESIPDAVVRGGALARRLMAEVGDSSGGSSSTYAPHQSEVRATVLLSPIGSSFDMFNNPFGARGDAFREAVRALPATERR